MDGERPLPSSSAIYIGGTGGKLRKPPLRKKPATPYDRPPAADQHPQRRDGGWLSKLVDPACRLIAGGATRILPSLFSRSPSTSDLTSSDHDDLGLDDADYQGTEATTNASNDDNRAVSLAVSKTSGEAGPSKLTETLKENTEYDKREQINIRNLCDDSELSKIEELVKGKLFSRDEINRLTEILKSKLVDNDDVDRKRKEPCLNDGGEAKLSLSAKESPLTLVEGKHEDMQKAILGTSTPHIHSKIQDDVAASPADIARAYMGSRTSETAFGSYSIRSKDEIPLQLGDELSSRRFIPPSSPKPSICWPGAMVPDQLGHTTPQTERGKFGLQNLPRTPYSRTIFSKSKGKVSQLQTDTRSLNISSSPFHQSRTSPYGQVKSRINTPIDGYGSVGPIRRLRNKFGSETRPSGSTSLYSVRNSPPEAEKATLLPNTENNSERAGTSSTPKYNSVDHMAHNNEITQMNSPANETVRKILEQLDRHKPTPKEIEAELKIASAWKRSPPEGKNDFIPKENRFDSNKKIDLFDQKLSNDERGHLNFKSNTPNNDIVSKSSSVVFGDHRLRNDTNASPSGAKKTSDSNITNTLEKDSIVTHSVPKDPSRNWPFNSQPNNGHNLATRVGPSGPLDKLPVSSKPTLKSISINKPDPRQIVSSDNALGFTFPVSKTSTALSEPPTPSIMPSFSTPQSKEKEPAVPTYTFGSKKSTPRLVFSFPSTSDTTKSDGEGQDIKFKFGSDKKKRVSFSSVEKHLMPWRLPIRIEIRNQLIDFTRL